MKPEPGRIARVRSRQYLIEGAVPPTGAGEQTPVRLSCVDDDAQGQPLEVLWEKEIDAEVIGETSWAKVAEKGFDPPRRFSAYLHTLRWNCVTSTDARARSRETACSSRSDLHTLFDRGYVTVTPEHRVEVSRRIREEFENGRDYYALAGRALRMPSTRELAPAASTLTGTGPMCSSVDGLTEVPLVGVSRRRGS